jgi:hypothetical protein
MIATVKQGQGVVGEMYMNDGMQKVAARVSIGKGSG